MVEKCRWSDAIVFAFVVIAFAVALALMWRFSNVLIASNQIVSVGGNVIATNQTEVVSQKVEHDSAISAYIEAEASLKNHFDSWMSILGLFGAAFGLLVPLGSYLIQHRSLTEERDQIRKDLDELRELQKEVESVKSGQAKLQGAFDRTNKPFWRALERSFEYSVISNPIAKGMYTMPKEYEIANLLLSMELMLDACVLSGDGELLKQNIYICDLIVGKLKNDRVIWKRACDAVRNGEQRTILVEGLHYLKLLDSGSREYANLKTLFGEVAPDKLP